MDSHLFRLNQMSYQHQKQFMNQQQRASSSQNNTTTRQHYSNRQQQQQQQQLQQQQHVAVGASPGAGHLISSTHHHPHHHHQQQLVTKHSSNNSQIVQSISQTSTSSAGSDQEEQVQLSSLSTATTSKSNSSSQAAILAGAKTSSQMQREQHHQMLRQQQQQQRHQQGSAAGQHRQAALQAHTLASLPPGNPKSLVAHSNKLLASSDQLTTSSDQTIDDLHHLAPHHHSSTTFNAGSGGAAAQHHRNQQQQHRHQLSSRYDQLASKASSKHHHSSSTITSQSGGGNRFLLGVLFTIAELLLFASVLLWLYWAYQHDDGLAWQSDRKQQFNTHAALMLFGFIFLSGQAMLIHRSFSCCSKIYTKILHTILFVLATSAISLGLILAYTAQENVGPNNKPIMHFYSLHAWCGLTTVGLFVLQFVFGFVSFLILLCCDQATANYRAALLPIHKTFGLIIFSLAIATCLTGLLQTARSRLSSKLNKVDYHELAEPGIVINLIGVCLICLAIIMPYIIRNLDIKRSFKSEFDRHLNRLSQLDMRI